MVIARRSCKFSLPPKSGIASIQWMALPQRSQPRGHPHAAHRRLLSRANAAEDLWSLPLKMHSIPTIGLSMVVSTLGDAPTQCCFDLANDGFRLHVYIPPCKKKKLMKAFAVHRKIWPNSQPPLCPDWSRWHRKGPCPAHGCEEAAPPVIYFSWQWGKPYVDMKWVIFTVLRNCQVSNYSMLGLLWMGK